MAYWALSVVEWAGALAVLAFSMRRTEMERLAAVVLAICLVVGGISSLLFPTSGQSTAEDYWNHADARAFVAMIEDATLAAIFWALQHRARWSVWLGTLFFAQETVYVVYVYCDHLYAALQAAEWLTFALFLAQLAVVGIYPRWPQIAEWWDNARRDDRCSLGDQRGFRRLGVRLQTTERQGPQADK